MPEAIPHRFDRKKNRTIFKQSIRRSSFRLVSRTAVTPPDATPSTSVERGVTPETRQKDRQQCQHEPLSGIPAVAVAARADLAVLSVLVRSHVIEEGPGAGRTRDELDTSHAAVRAVRALAVPVVRLDVKLPASGAPSPRVQSEPLEAAGRLRLRARTADREALPLERLLTVFALPPFLFLLRQTDDGTAAPAEGFHVARHGTDAGGSGKRPGRTGG